MLQLSLVREAALRFCFGRVVISRKALWDDFLVEYPQHGDPMACNDTSNDSDFEDIVTGPDDHSGTSESTIPTTQSVAENDETKPSTEGVGALEQSQLL